MTNGKWDRKVERTIIRLLDKTARQYGLKDMRHATNKWSAAQGQRLALGKKRRAIARAMADINRKLKGLPA